MKRDLEMFHPEVAVILGGVNDIYQGYPADFVKKNLKEMYELAAQKKAKVLACTILPFDDAGPDVEKKMKEINDWIRSYAQAHHFLFCDTSELLTDPKNPVNLI